VVAVLVVRVHEQITLETAQLVAGVELVVILLVGPMLLILAL
jgi:hypothetical protein